MAEKSADQKTSTGEVDPNSFSKDEIDQLSDLISDSATPGESFDGDKTGSFRSNKEDDTGEFKRVENSD
jgi:hypothetical protein